MKKVFGMLCERVIKRAVPVPVVFAVCEEEIIPLHPPEPSVMCFKMVKETVKTLNPKAVAVFVEATCRTPSGEENVLIGLFFTLGKRVVRVWKGTEMVGEFRGSLTIADYVDYSDVVRGWKG